VTDTCQVGRPFLKPALYVTLRHVTTRAEELIEIGKRVKATRERGSWAKGRHAEGRRDPRSQDAFAEWLGTSRRSVIAWENGSREPRDYAERLARAGEMRLEDFRLTPASERDAAAARLEERVRLLEAEVAQLRDKRRGFEGGA
jgi:predicted transcriptional regulator